MYLALYLSNEMSRMELVPSPEPEHAIAPPSSAFQPHPSPSNGVTIPILYQFFFNKPLLGEKYVEGKKKKEKEE